MNPLMVALFKIREWVNHVSKWVFTVLRIHCVKNVLVSLALDKGFPSDHYGTLTQTEEHPCFAFTFLCYRMEWTNDLYPMVNLVPVLQHMTDYWFASSAWCCIVHAVGSWQDTVVTSQPPKVNGIQGHPLLWSFIGQVKQTKAVDLFHLVHS